MGRVARCVRRTRKVREVEDMALRHEDSHVGVGDDNSRRLTVDGVRRGRAAPTIFIFPDKQVRVVVRGDDFTFAGTDLELETIKSKMHEWCDVKVRGILVSGRRDVQEIEIWGQL